MINKIKHYIKIIFLSNYRKNYKNYKKEKEIFKSLINTKVFDKEIEPIYYRPRQEKIKEIEEIIEKIIIKNNLK
jgi:hypothetical protein